MTKSHFLIILAGAVFLLCAIDSLPVPTPWYSQVGLVSIYLLFVTVFGDW